MLKVPPYPVVDCTKLPCVNIPEERPFISSTAGAITLALIPICAVVLGYFIRRWIKNNNDLTQLLTAVSSLKTDSKDHQLMLEKLTTIVNNTNTTLTYHLHYDHGVGPIP